MFLDLPPGLQKEALEGKVGSIQNEEERVRLFDKLFAMNTDDLRRLFESCTKKGLSELCAKASKEQISRLMHLVSPSVDSGGCCCVGDVERLDVSFEEDERGVPEALIDRGEDMESELFLQEVLDIMTACGDLEEALSFNAVLVKDSVGDWLRKCLEGGRRPKKMGLEMVGDMFPRQFQSFKRWLEAKSDGNTQDDLEEVEALLEGRSGFACRVENVEENFVLECLGIELGSKQRLQSFHLRTVLMSAEKYVEFSGKRAASLTAKPSHRKAFCSWIGISTSTAPVVINFLGYIVWDRIEIIMGIAAEIRRRVVQLKEQCGVDKRILNGARKKAFRYQEVRLAIEVVKRHLGTEQMKEESNLEVPSKRLRSRRRTRSSS